jgi:hypothetical protein
MDNVLDRMLCSAETLWIPVACDFGEEVEEGLWRSKTYFGTPTADKREAWTAARHLCDEMGGSCFTVRRAQAPTARG